MTHGAPSHHLRRFALATTSLVVVVWLVVAAAGKAHLDGTPDEVGGRYFRVAGGHIEEVAKADYDAARASYVRFLAGLTAPILAAVAIGSSMRAKDA